MKVRQLHVINCNSLLNKALALVKPFLGADVAERIHFHTPDSDSLFKYVPKEVLPKVFASLIMQNSLIKIYYNKQELGGTCGTIDEWQNHMYEYLYSYRYVISFST